MKERFEELLPWYVNGTLAGEDHVWVESYLAEHPESRSELDWYRSLGQRIQDNAPSVPATIGLDQAMKRIRADRPSLAARVSAFFGTLGVRPGIAFAGLAVFAVQGAVIVSLMHAAHDDAAEMRALRASTTEDRPMLKLSFAPDAKETDIRYLLIAMQGHLVGGPGQLGDYFVVVPNGKEAAIAEQLQSNPIVLSASLVPGLPPRE